MPEGWSVVESYLPPRHAVDVLNDSSVPLEMARIPDDALIPFYTTCVLNTADTKLSLPSPLAKTWTPPVPRNKRWRTYLDLNEALHGAGGFVASQVYGPSYGHENDRWFHALDDVTRLGITLKSSPDSTLVWTSFLRYRRPGAARVPVELRSDANQSGVERHHQRAGLRRCAGLEEIGHRDLARTISGRRSGRSPKIPKAPRPFRPTSAKASNPGASTYRTIGRPRRSSIGRAYSRSAACTVLAKPFTSKASCDQTGRRRLGARPISSACRCASPTRAMPRPSLKPPSRLSGESSFDFSYPVR